MTAYDALVEHFDRADRRETPEQVAHNAIAVLLNLPVEQRMEAMGMRKRLLADVWANDNRMMPLWTE